jgi:hypothetical protein
VPRRAGLLLAALLVPLAVACGDDGAATDVTTGPDTTEAAREVALGGDAVIEYRYGDSSVPPEYHRSYTLTVTRERVDAVVDSYGEVLHEISASLPREVWRELSSAGEVVAIDEPGDGEGCAGGTSRRLEIDDGGTALVDLGFGVCGTESIAAGERVDRYIAPAIGAIPDWDRYLEIG